jgi:hypothetical protein
MAIKCPKCGNANPDNARYCWSDGAILTTQSSLTPFRFRNGAVANSLLELGAQVDSNWEEGKYHLYSGDFANWLSGIGRGDLSSIARNIVLQEKNEDTGLEKFLQSFGVDAPPLPQLIVKETSLDFGRVDVNLISSGKYTRQFHLTNPGRGYLYGNIVSSVSWLRLDTSGFNGNNIKVTATAVKPGKRGTIIIRSNAGTKKIPVTMAPVHPWWKPILMYGGIGVALGITRIIIAMIYLAVGKQQFGIWLFGDISSSVSKPWLINHVWFISQAIILSIIGAIGAAIWHKIRWSRLVNSLSGAVVGGVTGIVIFFLFLPLDHALVYILHQISPSSTNRIWGVIICWNMFGLFLGITTGVCRWLVRIRRYCLCAVPAVVLTITFFMLWAMGNTAWGNQMANFLLANIRNWL